MLILGCIIAIVLIVFLSNAAPRTTTGTIKDAAASAVAAVTETTLPGGSGTTGGPSPPPLIPSQATPDESSYDQASSSNKDTLQNGEILNDGDSLISKNGKFKLTYEYGRVNVKSGTFNMWTSDGRLMENGVAKITDDGNFGTFQSRYSVSAPGWSSATAGRGIAPYSLVMQDDGQLIMYDSTESVIWSAPVTQPPVSRDCVLGDWSEWGPCSTTCGTGTQTRTRTVLTQPGFGGAPCEALSESRECNTTPCPDCTVSEWSAWSPCSAGGVKTRTRTIISDTGPGGKTCPELIDTASCTNCQVSAWSAWSPCSASGQKTQTRTVTIQPADGGDPCPPLQNVASCTNCVMSDWFAATPCSNDTGTLTQKRTVRTPAASGGDPCPTDVSKTVTCPVDCEMNDWQPWGACSTTCGGGTQTRNRSVKVTAKNGGNACPATQEQQSCNMQPCPIDCEVGDWSDWNQCSKTCGGGVQSRTRQPLPGKDAANGGRACPNLTEERSCNTQSCEVPAPPGDTMVSNQYLNPDQRLYSRNGRFMLIYQLDGSFGMYDLNYRTSGWKWGYGNHGEAAGKVLLDASGNINIKDSGGRVMWSGGANGQGPPPYRMRMQCDGNLVIYDNNNNPKWATNTWLVPTDTCTEAWHPTAPTYNYESNRDQDGRTLNRYYSKTRAECESLCTQDDGCQGIITGARNNTARADCFTVGGFPNPYYSSTRSIARKVWSEPAQKQAA